MADEPLKLALGRPFAEQIAALRIRFADLRPTASWRDLWQGEHDRAFAVAGALKADLLADLARAVDRSITEGRTLDWFHAEFRKIVARHGWTGWTGEGTETGEAWRSRVIWRTNIATSYAAGRRAQLIAGGFRLWVYRHGGSREPRPEHLAWDGLALPPDHDFWATHSPPNGWGCSCYLRGANTPAGVRRVGGDPDKRLPEGWNRPDPRSGAPKGIDRGWAYAPGARTTEAVRALAAKIPALPAPLGADLGSAAAELVDRDWTAWLSRARARPDTPPQLAGTLSRAVIDALAARDVAPRSAEIMVRPGLIAGPKADRHEAAGDALTEADWDALPAVLRNPSAVYLDLRTGRLIYVGPTAADTRRPQIAVALDYATTVSREKRTVNMVVSAYRPKAADIAARIAGGLLAVLLTGSLP